MFPDYNVYCTITEINDENGEVNYHLSFENKNTQNLHDDSRTFSSDSYLTNLNSENNDAQKQQREIQMLTSTQDQEARNQILERISSTEISPEQAQAIIDENLENENKRKLMNMQVIADAQRYEEQQKKSKNWFERLGNTLGTFVASSIKSTVNFLGDVVSLVSNVFVDVCTLNLKQLQSDLLNGISKLVVDGMEVILNVVTVGLYSAVINFTAYFNYLHNINLEKTKGFPTVNGYIDNQQYYIIKDNENDDESFANYKFG
jgi:hypothetical protein